MEHVKERTEVLCDHVKMSLSEFPDAFWEWAKENRQNLDKRTPTNWLKKNPKLNAEKTKAYIAFWRTRIPEFSQHQTMLSLDNLRRWTKDLSSAKPSFDRHKKVNEFAAAYQIIRPHTSDKDCYVLEAMAIERSESADQVLFYSHNHPDPTYLYEGRALVAERYLFALMHRAHQDGPGQNSFRSITFYIGNHVEPACFAGLLTRGTSGDSARKGSVSMPVIALRIGTGDHLRCATFSALKAPRGAAALRRLKPGAALLTGEVRKHWYPDLHAFCARYFETGLEKGDLFAGNPLVLHSIAPSTILSTADVGLDRWDALASELVDAPMGEASSAPSGG